MVSYADEVRRSYCSVLGIIPPEKTMVCQQGKQKNFSKLQCYCIIQTRRHHHQGQLSRNRPCTKRVVLVSSISFCYSSSRVPLVSSDTGYLSDDYTQRRHSKNKQTSQMRRFVAIAIMLFHLSAFDEFFIAIYVIACRVDPMAFRPFVKR